MTHAPSLEADRPQIARFVDALFRYADEGTYVSLRSFYDGTQRVFGIIPHTLTSDLSRLVDAATREATRAARCGSPVVFAPPIATFSNPEQAREVDLANGLALSVECDSGAQAARTMLETLLGPATIVVASGGEWVDPELGTIEPKLHLHWRLTEPTRDEEAHAQLKKARSLAMLLVGSDPTSKPAVHPMRWPGSWHRKAAPRLARIVSDTEAEIELVDAIQKLEEAWAASPARTTNPMKADAAEAAGESRDTAELVAAVLTASDYHAPVTALAMRLLKAGMPDRQAVLVLRGIMQAVPEDIRDIKDASPQPGRWQARFDDIPRAVSTARAKLEDTRPPAPPPVDIGQFRLDQFTSGEPQPQRFLLYPFMPLGKVGLLFGPGGVGKSITALDLCLSVATRDRVSPERLPGTHALGGTVPAEAAGASVFLTLEDDADEIHRRITSLDPSGIRLGAPCYVIPAVDLPDFNPTLVTANGRVAALTEFAQSGLDHLLTDTQQRAGRPVSLLVLDPAGDFLDVDENDASFVKLLLRRLRVAAAHHGCTILILGHVAKSIDPDAPTMRGSSAWIANSRFAFAIWKPLPDDAEKVAGTLGMDANTLVRGSLVKANHAGAPAGVKRLYSRDDTTGRLIDITSQLDNEKAKGAADAALMGQLVSFCAECAAAGLPFSYSGVGGLWSGREDLPEQLAKLSKHKLEGLCTQALETGLLVKARTSHSQSAPRFLDVPNGPLAQGDEVEMFHGSRAEALARWRAAKGR
jgi:hypothetical protein